MSYVAYHLYAKRKIRSIDYTSLFGLSLAIPPSVFHPALYFSSKALARYVRTLPLEKKRVLDMGCGCGIIGLLAASAGAVVTAVDLNSRAVEATRDNANRNGLTNTITVVQSDLFDELPDGSTFDAIIWNPPFYPGTPMHESELAWKAGENLDVIRRFSRAALNYLTPEGVLVIILSSETGVPAVLEMFRTSGYQQEKQVVIPHLFERFFILQFRRPNGKNIFKEGT